MHRFRVEAGLLQSETVLLNKEESRHAITVLRLKNGDVVELFDGKGKSAGGIVTGFEDGQVSVMVNQNKMTTCSPRTEITLAVSVIKPEPMDLLIQKACELGVSCIQPLLTDRTVVQLSNDRWENKIKRWNKIASESCKQCGQSRVPLVEPVLRFKEFLKKSWNYSAVLIPTLAVKGEPLKIFFERNSSAKSLLALIGPEGDFSAEEVREVEKKGGKPVNLGGLVMRSETAGIYVLSAAQFYYQSSFNVD
jgi:16S rRNA (uracil1498-N3)-methyltransferase